MPDFSATDPGWCKGGRQGAAVPISRSADAIGDGLTTLRPAPLQRLLETVGRVKERWLTLWLADRHAQPWRERLGRDRIDLGTGKLALVPNPRLDPTYLITYPRGLDAGG